MQFKKDDLLRVELSPTRGVACSAFEAYPTNVGAAKDGNQIVHFRLFPYSRERLVMSPEGRVLEVRQERYMLRVPVSNVRPLAKKPRAYSDTVAFPDIAGSPELRIEFSEPYDVAHCAAFEISVVEPAEKGKNGKARIRLNIFSPHQKTLLLCECAPGNQPTLRFRRNWKFHDIPIRCIEILERGFGELTDIDFVL